MVRPTIPSRPRAAGLSSPDRRHRLQPQPGLSSDRSPGRPCAQRPATPGTSLWRPKAPPPRAPARRLATWRSGQASLSRVRAPGTKGSLGGRPVPASLQGSDSTAGQPPPPATAPPWAGLPSAPEPAFRRNERGARGAWPRAAQDTENPEDVSGKVPLPRPQPQAGPSRAREAVARLPVPVRPPVCRAATPTSVRLRAVPGRSQTAVPSFTRSRACITTLFPESARAVSAGRVPRWPPGWFEACYVPARASSRGYRGRIPTSARLPGLVRAHWCWTPAGGL